jgi:hypothetical protein
MPYPSHPPRLDHSNYIWQRVQVMKFLIMQFSPTAYYFIPRVQMFFRDQVSHAYKTTDLTLFNAYNYKSTTTLRWEPGYLSQYSNCQWTEQLKVSYPRSGADHSPLPSANSTSTPPYIFMVCSLSKHKDFTTFRFPKECSFSPPCNPITELKVSV